MSPMPLVGMRHIKKYFGGVHAVDDVNLELFAGEALGILGHNGPGPINNRGLGSRSLNATGCSWVITGCPCFYAVINSARLLATTVVAFFKSTSNKRSLAR